MTGEASERRRRERKGDPQWPSGGKVALQQGVVRTNIGIRGETVAAIAETLGQGALEIDASDRLVAPGGIDPHAHIEQVSGGGLLNADSFESATTAAA